MSLAEEQAPVSRGTGLAAWRQIVDRLSEDIASGRLAKGDRMPSEMDLAARFSVNRHTVRRALSHLAQQGVVRSVQGKGSFVEANGASQAAPAGKRLQEDLPKPGKEVRGILLFAAHHGASAEVAEALAVEPGAPVLELHSACKQGDAISSLATSWLPLPRFVGLDTHFARKGSLAKALARYGVEDCRRIATRIFLDFAHGADAAGMGVSTGEPLLVLVVVNTDQEGRPVQMTRIVYPVHVELVHERHRSRPAKAARDLQARTALVNTPE